MSAAAGHDDEVSVLALRLHDRLVGYLAGFRSGRIVLHFDDSFRLDPARPTFSLITHPAFPKADQLMETPWVRRQRLPPTLSNLLPEGALRELVAQGLKTHVDNEFQIFSYLGQDLPGALVAAPVDVDCVPSSMIVDYGNAKVINVSTHSQRKQFSLAGVQMKFSMKEKDGRYNLTSGALGDWIIKTPSTKHKFVPLNEFTAMTLASLVGVDIPEIKLVKLNQLDNLPQVNLPDETLAFAIRRFDREAGKRIHMEDFAQVLVQYPHDKYTHANYEQIGKVLYQYSGDGLEDVQQFARRLLANILLANGDAHLKNWSLLYADRVTPRLAPAYDLVTTKVYIEDETKFALNLGRTKDWYNVTMDHFQLWADKLGLPWRAVESHLHDVLEKARDLWPSALKDLPMYETHKKKLQLHWQRLHADFRIV